MLNLDHSISLIYVKRLNAEYNASRHASQNAAGNQNEISNAGLVYCVGRDLHRDVNPDGP